MFDRRRFLLQSLMSLASVPILSTVAAADDAILVYKSPTCGCCSAWIDHLRDAGFVVRHRNIEDVAAIKGRHGVPRQMWSCHTAIVGDYVVEGHVPAEDIRRLLEQAPQITGLAVPGMPAGSPGMEVDGYREAFNVWAFGGESLEAFARYSELG
jgi:hypothetical protein